MMCAVVNLYSHLLHSFAGLESLDEAVHDCFLPATGIIIIFTLTFKNRASHIEDRRTATLQMLHYIYILFQQI